METIGKIDKPSVEQFKTGRKLYCVPLVYSSKDAPQEYLEIINQYWTQVEEHVNMLEKVEKISKIYFESVSVNGEEAIQIIKEENEKAYKLVKIKYESGGQLQALEDQELFNERMDWMVCMAVVGRSPIVLAKVSKFFEEANKKRDEYIVKQIVETLKEDEAGMLVMNDQDRVRIQSQFPADIHVFLVHPRALDDIYRWLRDHSSDKTL
jgi:hypothetical protein